MVPAGVGQLGVSQVLLAGPAAAQQPCFSKLFSLGVQSPLGKSEFVREEHLFLVGACRQRSAPEFIGNLQAKQLTRKEQVFSKKVLIFYFTIF